MTLKLEGFGQLDRRFTALTAVGQRSVLGKALKARGVLVRDEAKSRAPKGRTGNLSEGIELRQKSETDVSEAVTQVGTGKKEFYGYFVHFGTGRGFDAAAARALGYPGRSRSTRRNVPGIPFLTDAVAATESSGHSAMESVLQKEITKAENS